MECIEQLLCVACCQKVRSSFVDLAVVERGVDGAVVHEDQVDPSVGVGLRCEEGFVDDAVGVVARGVVPRAGVALDTEPGVWVFVAGVAAEAGLFPEGFFKEIFQMVEHVTGGDHADFLSLSSFCMASFS